MLFGSSFFQYALARIFFPDRPIEFPILVNRFLDVSEELEVLAPKSLGSFPLELNSSFREIAYEKSRATVGLLTLICSFGSFASKLSLIPETKSQIESLPPPNSGFRLIR